ncbi:MAG: YdeI/OmpD-associated family protein [Thermoplasmatota archaeon]
MITDIEDYFAKGCGRCDRFDTAECSTKLWADGVAALRRICLDAGLSEHVKWGHPTYMHAGRNIVIIGALQGDFRLSFFNAALMKDPEGVLLRQGPNTQHPDMFQFTENGAVAAVEATIRAYLEEAKGYAEAGIKPPKVERELELPEELVGAMDADPEMAEAFHALTPGRQRSYVIHLAGAKKAETRVARIVRFRPKVLAGKGFNEY